MVRKIGETMTDIDRRGFSAANWEPAPEPPSFWSAVICFLGYHTWRHAEEFPYAVIQCCTRCPEQRVVLKRYTRWTGWNRP